MKIRYYTYLVLLALSCSFLYTACDKEDVNADAVQLNLSQLPYDNLSDYQLFTGELAAMIPNERVLPYELNTPLFSDYSKKFRFIYMPEGQGAVYNDSTTFDFPVGTVIIKTFSFLDDIRDENSDKRILETRLLVRFTDKWEVYSYLWNDEQTEARFSVVGRQEVVSWTHFDGNLKTANYLIPNQNECLGCHSTNKEIMPIGPKARNLNGVYNYADGSSMNQLSKWIEMGFLTNAPSSPELAPRAAVWNDPTSGNLDDRARAYLDVNCGHCHNPAGPANNSGLNLYLYEDNPFYWGVCKPPIAAGQGSGGLDYSIVPGDPDASIMLHRMNSVELDVAMPELARSVIHDEAIVLIRDWITNLDVEGCD